MARRLKHLDEPDVPSNSFTYFLREAVRRIWTSKRASFVAVSMMTISLLILGIFLLVAENLDRAVAQWQGKTRVNLYFDPEASGEHIAAVEQFLAATPELSRRT